MLAAGLTLFYLSMFPVVFIAIRWQHQAETAAMANVASLERLNKLLKQEAEAAIRQETTARRQAEAEVERLRRENEDLRRRLPPP